MTHLRNELRSPTFSSQGEYQPEHLALSSITSRALGKVIAITGTSGSPGRSRLAVESADHYGATRAVHLWDLDFSNPAIAYHLGSQQREMRESIELSVMARDGEIASLAIDPEKITIFDIGLFPDWATLATDRRWHPHLINRALDLSDCLIYVVASSGLHLLRLEEFMRNFPRELRKIPIIYLLTQQIGSREERAVESRFRELTAGEASLTMPPAGTRGRREAFERLLLLIDECDR